MSETLEALRQRLKQSEIAYSVSCHRGDPEHVTEAWYAQIVRAHGKYETARSPHNDKN